MFTTKGLIFSNNYWKGPNVLLCYNKGRIKLQYLQERTKYITMFTTKNPLCFNTYWKEPNISQWLLQIINYITMVRTNGNYITMITKDQFYYNTHNKRPILLQYSQQAANFITIVKTKDKV
jgi:hypothetical protein